MKRFGCLFLLVLMFFAFFVGQTDLLQAYWTYDLGGDDYFTSVTYDTIEQPCFCLSGSFYRGVNQFSLDAGIFTIDTLGTVIDSNFFGNDTIDDSCAFLFVDESDKFIFGANNNHYNPFLCGSYQASNYRDSTEQDEQPIGGGSAGTDPESEYSYYFIGSARVEHESDWDILLFYTDSEFSEDIGNTFVIGESRVDEEIYGFVEIDPGNYLVVGSKDQNQYIARISCNDIDDSISLNSGELHSAIIIGDYAYICGYENFIFDKRMVIHQWDINGDSIVWTGYTPYISGYDKIGYDIIKGSDGHFYVGGDQIGYENSSDAVIAEFNEGGSYVTSYVFDSDNSTGLRGMVEISSGIYFCGFMENEGELDALLATISMGEGDGGNLDNPIMSPAVAPSDNSSTSISVKPLFPLVGYRDITDQVDIIFELNSPQQVQIKVYDVTGAEITCLTDQYFTQGTHQVVWNGLNNRQQQINSGVYFIKIISGNQVISEKVIFTQ